MSDLKKNRLTMLCLVLGVINLTLVLFLFQSLPRPEATQPLRHTLYIGLNDQDTLTQLIPTDEAMRRVNEICARHVDGYTVTTAHGGWTDDSGVLTREETLVYTFSEVEEAKIRQIMDEVLRALNQQCILWERQSVTSTFYSGSTLPSPVGS